jgi:hypothetical protein
MHRMPILFSVFLLASPLVAQAGTISISPAVISLSGKFGQSTTQKISLTNGTNQPLDFTLEAHDIIVRDGKRVFVPAGRQTDGIAASAVFSQRQVTVPAGQTRGVDVTVTVPPKTEQRAVVVYFRGTSLIQAKAAKTTASLGSLLTFTLSDRTSLASRDLVVKPQTSKSNTSFSQDLSNDGTEPVVISGTAVVVDRQGRLVGRADFQPQRLLPGETGAVHTDFPAELERGNYRAVSTLAFERKTVTKAAEFRVP